MRKKIVINDETRLFIQSLDKNACEREYNYHSSVAVSDVRLSKSEGQKQYRQSDNKYDEFDLYNTMNGYIQSGSSSLSTNYPYEKSILGKYFSTKCLFDMQVHFGKCESDPGNFAKFDKALIFKGVDLNSYNIATLIASDSASRSKVTESSDFTFERMYEISRPTFTLIESNVINDGPIIDSFIYCDTLQCTNCKESSGIYYIQLVSCGNDCQMVRVVYSYDLGASWRIHNISICDNISCSQDFNTNIVKYNNLNYYFDINVFSGNSLNQIINNGIHILSATDIINTHINRAFGKYNSVFYACSNGRILFFSDGTLNRVVNNKLSIHDNIIDIHSSNGESFIAGSSQGKVYFGNINNEIEYLVIPNSGDVNSVYMLTECSYLASTGNSGGVVIRNGKVTKMKGVHGTITKFAFFNDDIGYCVSISGNKNHIWQSVDGGLNWQEIDKSLSTNYVITSIKICEYNHNFISISGRKMSSAVSVSDALNRELDWGCLGTGFAMISK